ncbi:secretoglobin family 2B member 20-like isoform X2 [Mus musculus]|uniref:secretoglobin family 2B member 20-like isoform X2 n=1 Tax=Mus musculus TaxID=10090 RepID=UPI000154CA3A|nr:secretoglobin family 2B member 20-like isoform X2 [Mus musculus]EDL23942.1 mCG1031299 [Mus musculus]|eukprot:XP_006540550.1 PREDICTED: secretoglobin family 2B member 20 isoform X2 [Mus musculus]
MKGTLLLLTLLVTGELTFHTSETRVPFFKGYASVLSGKRLYQELQTFNATAEEAMVSSQESQSNYEVDNISSILDYISRLLGE